MPPTKGVLHIALLTLSGEKTLFCKTYWVLVHLLFNPSHMFCGIWSNTKIGSLKNKMGPLGLFPQCFGRCLWISECKLFGMSPKIVLQYHLVFFYYWQSSDNYKLLHPLGLSVDFSSSVWCYDNKPCHAKYSLEQRDIPPVRPYRGYFLT